MDMNEPLAKAVTQATDAVRGVKPDQLGAPTPCRDWDVQTLTNHLLQVIHALNLAGHREQVPGDLWTRDLMSGDWAGRFEDDAHRAVAAWTDPAAWQGTVGMGATDMPAPLLATMLASDLAIHGWDLARATGQDYRCEDDVAEMALRFIADTAEQGREMGLYAEPVPVPGGSSALDRTLALSGRDPQWGSGARLDGVAGAPSALPPGPASISGR